MRAVPISGMASSTHQIVSEGRTADSVISWARGRSTPGFRSTLWPDGIFQGLPSSFLPEHAFSFTAGWGNGLFKEGGGLDWYTSGDSGGWFAGMAWNLELAESRMVTFMTEYNGFDWNVGTQVDLSGVRLGAHALGVNHSSPTTVYRSSKFGVVASVALCGRGLCRASLRDRPDPDVVVLPAAPPDTVVVTRVETRPPPAGAAATLCLSTGDPIEVLLTLSGDHTRRTGAGSFERATAGGGPCGCVCG